ncbi:hypothetical protein [Cochleicola gelatinilyticus]|uniref:Uncharacterized protein n=1 Tax=Cochleicola gelatinilyticus TaxID=1763537 RepID=A0A167H531_9FLAO|nr:hypothetical protein [Cochleicola gelatinilyticus]OAB78224.1 hypothetical protein ULVI_12160 [Cochleicola gelatinilyticus]
MGKKTKLEVKAEIQKKYNTLPKAYGGYANDPKEQPIVPIFEKVAARINMKPSYLFTIAAGEGLGVNHLDFDDNFRNGVLITDQQVDGFQALGLDYFSSPQEYPRFKKYLPSDYNIGDEYERYDVRRAEKNRVEVVPSAKFKDMQSAIDGFGAIIAHRKSLFESHYNAFGYSNPTEDEIAYWVYAYYQGEGDAKRELKANGGFDFMNGNGTSIKQVHNLALERVASWRYLLTYNIFSS